MSWLSRNDFTPSDKLHADDLNNLANDQRTWGGNVNGGGYTLSNVVLVGVSTRAAEVTSVFGRSGDVIAQSGDYTAAQVGAVPTARQVIAGPGLAGGGNLSADITLSALVTSVFGRTGAVTLTPADINSASGVTSSRIIASGTGLTGGGNLSADRTLSVVPDTTNQQVQVFYNSGVSPVGTRHAINFIPGANVTLTVVDNNANNRVDVTVASTGGTGGMTDPTTQVGDLIVRGPVTVGALAKGSDGQVLTVDSTRTLGLKWAAATGGGNVASVFGRTGAITAAAGDYTAALVTNAVSTISTYADPAWITSLAWAKIINVPAFMLDPTSSKGDLIVHGPTTTRLPIGADGSTLIADSTVSLGVRWGAVPISVSSVFGRTGAVVAATGDYSVAQVTGAVASTRNINTGTGLGGGGNLSADRTLVVVPDTTNQQVQILSAGTNISTRHAINFIPGANVAISITDDPPTTGNNRVNVVISSTGGGGGMVDPTTSIGDLIVRGPGSVQRLGAGLNGQVLTVDSSVGLGLKWAYPTGGGGGGQTPWTSNIEGANFTLSNVAAIGVNGPSSVSTTRISVTTTGSEEVLTGTSTLATSYASLTLTNSASDTLRLRNYGPTYATNPETAAIESSIPLRLLANSAEVMRLTGGHVLIGTTSDDGVEILQVAGKVKSAAGYVFPDGTLQTTASTPATAPVTSVFGRTGAVVAQSGDYTASQVTNAVSTAGSYADPPWITSLSWTKITGAPSSGVSSVFGRTGAVTAQSGDYSASQITNAVSTAGSYADPPWITSLSWAKLTGTPSISTFQSPWLTNIDGAGFMLQNAGKVSINVPTTTAPFSRLHVRAGASGAAAAINGDTVVFAEHSSSAYYEIVAGATKQAGMVLGANGQPNSANIMDTWDGTNHVLALNANVAGSYLTLITAGTEKMRITSAGNVGIGTTNPLNLFQVHGAANQNIGIRSNASRASFGAYNDAGTASQPMGFDASQFDFAGGNVGIGTATPGVALDILNSATSQMRIQQSVGSGALYFQAGGGGASTVLQFTKDSSFSRAAGIGMGIVSGTAQDDLVFSTYPGTAWYERMRIMATGNVGIGTATPNRLLDVEASSGWVARFGNSSVNMDVGALVDGANVGINSPSWGLGFQTNSATRMTITVAGNVGIGTVNPSQLLHIYSGTAAALQITTTASSSAYIIMQRIGQQWWMGPGVAGDASWILYDATAAAYRVSVTPGGNVGIGIAGPSYRLHTVGGRVYHDSSAGDMYTVGLYGTGSAGAWLGVDASSNFFVADSPGNQRLVVTQAGNVGISVTNPQGRFEVEGHMSSPAFSGGGHIAVFGAAYDGSNSTLAIGSPNGGYYPMWIQAYQNPNMGGNGSTPLCFQPIGGTVNIGTLTPSGYLLHVQGDCNITGTYRVNGTPFSGGAITTQSANIAASRSFGAVYQNSTGKPMMVTVAASVGANTGATSSGGIYAQTDSANPPTQIVAYQMVALTTNGPSGEACITFWVLPGNFYKVSTSANGSPSIGTGFWTEWN